MDNKGALGTMEAKPGREKVSFSRGSIESSRPDINLDDAVLEANGHKAEMPRQFNWISALGLGFSITNSWAGYLVCIRLQRTL